MKAEVHGLSCLQHVGSSGPGKSNSSPLHWQVAFYPLCYQEVLLLTLSTTLQAPCFILPTPDPCSSSRLPPLPYCSAFTLTSSLLWPCPHSPATVTPDAPEPASVLQGLCICYLSQTATLTFWRSWTPTPWLLSKQDVSSFPRTFFSLSGLAQLSAKENSFPGFHECKLP